MLLTKTDFLQYLRCSKNLWLKKNRPDLYVPETPSEFEESKLEEGIEVELLARELFRDGVLVGDDLHQALETTARLIEVSKPTLFQATISSSDGCLVRVDILRLNTDSNHWDIYEVKSATEVKTDRSHNHIKDVAFQALVLQHGGLKVGRKYIVLLNKDYTRRGALDVSKLFKIVDITSEVDQALESTDTELKDALSLCSERQIDLSYCDCLYLTRGNHCSSFSVLNPSVPEYSVHDIPRIRTDKIRQLIDSGVVKIQDVSDSFKLTDIQRAQVRLSRTQEAEIDKATIATALSKLTYPLYYFDYETYCAAIPILDGYRPYQHIPFQVSIHRLLADGTLDHLEYLCTEMSDVPYGVLDYLKNMNIRQGTIISWHASFESTRNSEMAVLYPQYAGVLGDLNNRTFDLEPIFKKDYLHPAFRGSSSIKKVLPALIPQFSYGGLAIQGGTEAMEQWRKMMFVVQGNAEKDAIVKALLDYCGMDTMAMVEIFKHLQSRVQ